MSISIDLDAKPYLRHWNFALTSKISSNWCFDRLKQVFEKWFPRGKLHLTRKSGELLQRRSNSWKLAWEPVETPVWRCFWGQCEISVSKIRFSIQIYWNSHQNITKTENELNIMVKKWTLLFFPVFLMDAKAYLRYWNFALTSKTSSNWCFDRLPSKFSKQWFSLEGNCTWREKARIPCSGKQIFENLLGNLSQPRFDDVFEVSAKFQYRR